MAKGGKKPNTYHEAEADVWNVAEGFVKLKVLKPLVMFNKFITVAQFGTEEIGEDINFSDEEIKKKRVEALERFLNMLRQLIDDCDFAIQKKDIDFWKSTRARLDVLEEYLPHTYSSKEDPVDNKEVFTINEKLFKKILIILREIVRNLNKPLNNSGLIFRVSDEVDLDKIMNDIIEGG